MGSSFSSELATVVASSDEAPGAPGLPLTSGEAAGEKLAACMLGHEPNEGAA